MKLEQRDETTGDAETEVNKYLEEIKDLENVTGFISCVMLGDGRAMTIVAANSQQMLKFANELTNLSIATILNDRGKEKVTLQ